MSQGKFLSEGLLVGGDDGAGLEMTELPSEYLVKLNVFLRNAIHDGHETLTRVLLDKGADVNYTTSNSQLPTALHVAVSSTRENILPIILPQASSATIQAALQFAIQYQSRLTNIINILQKDGSVASNNGNTKDKDKDKSAVDKPSKEAPQKSLQESETQTTPPSRQESETQTNGEGNGQKPSDERGERKEESEEKIPKETSVQLHEQHTQQQQQQLLQQQFQDHQKQLIEQQHRLQEQLTLNEQIQKKAESAQQAASNAQHVVEELKVQLKTQDELLESQKGQVQKLTSQLASQEELTQKLKAQLTDQETNTQKLTDQVTEQNNAVQKLSEEVREGETQIAQLKARIAELENEKSELRASFQALEAKSVEREVELHAQVVALQKDIEAKTRKIENISTERDSERRAKEVVKRILTSNPKGTPENAETLGHSHAIRMGSLRTPSPSPPDSDDIPHHPPSPSPTLRHTKQRASSSNINGYVTPRGFESEKKSENPQFRRSKTGENMVALVSSPGKGLSSKSRSKDDMDIASEADRARVRRLVERWEEMKYLELPTKQ